MKHLRKILPAVLLAAVTVVAMCIIAFSSPINTTELDTSLAAYTVPNTEAQDLIPVADPTSDKTPAFAHERLKRRRALSNDSLSLTLISAIIDFPPSNNKLEMWIFFRQS